MTGDIAATKVNVVPAPLGTSNESTKLNFIKVLIGAARGICTGDFGSVKQGNDSGFPAEVTLELRLEE